MCRPGTTSSPVLVSADAIWYHTRIVVRPYLKNTSLQLVTVDARVRLIHALLRTPDRVPGAAARLFERVPRSLATFLARCDGADHAALEALFLEAAERGE